MNSFAVTLLSNASKDRHTDNKPSSFTNDLESAITIDGEWEVGLKQIQCSNNIAFKTRRFTFVAWFGKDGYLARNNNPEFRVEPDAEYLKLTNLQESGRHNLDNYDCARIIVDEGTWKSAMEFGYYLAKLMHSNLRRRHIMSDGTSMLRDVQYYYNEATQIADFVVISPADQGYIGITTTEHEYMSYLGLAESPRCETNNDVKMYLFDRDKNHKPTVQCEYIGFPGPDSLFVYTDIVENQLVAEKHGGLLQVVPCKSGVNYSRNFVTFDKPAYIRLKPRSVIPSISIRLVDVNGDDVDFYEERTFTCLQLIFRKKQVYGWA